MFSRNAPENLSCGAAACLHHSAGVVQVCVCLYVCMCVCVCVCVCMCVHTYIHTYVNSYRYMHPKVGTQIHDKSPDRGGGGGGGHASGRDEHSRVQTVHNVPHNVPRDIMDGGSGRDLCDGKEPLCVILLLLPLHSIDRPVNRLPKCLAIYSGQTFVRSSPGKRMPRLGD